MSINLTKKSKKIRSNSDLNKLPTATDDWWYEAFNTTRSGGQTVNSNTAQRIAAVYACCSAICESVAMLPVVIYSEDDKVKSKVKDHTLYRLLHDQPNELMDSFNFFESMQTQLLDNGNAYAYISRKKSGAITSLMPLEADKMNVKVQANFTLGYEYKDSLGQTRKLTSKEIFHVKYRTKDGLVGRSPIKVAADVIGYSLSLQEHGSKLFENGAFLSGFLSSPLAFKDDEARERFMNSFKKYMGSVNSGKFALLEQGVDFKPYSMNNMEAQFLEDKKFSVLDIARIYRVPPVMIQVTESGMSYASIEQLAIIWIQYTIQPWVVRYEKAIKTQLLNDVGEENYFARFNVSSLIRGDLKTRTESLVQQLQYGLKTINEARNLLDDNAVDDEIADKILISHNLIPADTLNQNKLSETTPTQQQPQQIKSKRQQFEPLFVEIIGRIVRQEVSAIKKESKKTGFIRWASEEFIPKQQERFKKSLEPALIAFESEISNIDLFIDKYYQWRKEQFIESTKEDWQGWETVEKWQSFDVDTWVNKLFQIIEG